MSSAKYSALIEIDVMRLLSCFSSLASARRRSNNHSLRHLLRSRMKSYHCVRSDPECRIWSRKIRSDTDRWPRLFLRNNAVRHYFIFFACASLACFREEKSASAFLIVVKMRLSYRSTTMLGLEEQWLFYLARVMTFSDEMKFSCLQQLLQYSNCILSRSLNFQSVTIGDIVIAMRFI